MMSKTIKFPCGVCNKTVAKNHNAVYCDSCDRWVHLKCNFLNKNTYRKLQKDNSPWFCINCVKNHLPFQSQANINNNQNYISLDKSTTISDLLENLDMNEENPSSEYYTPNEFSNLKLEKSNLFIHLNISSLSYYIDELNILLSQMKHKPKIIAISESRIKQKKDPLSKINIPGYSYVFTPTEGEEGGTLLYISQDLAYKNRSDLNIYQSKQLESSFVEIKNKNKKNSIVGCI